MSSFCRNVPLGIVTQKDGKRSVDSTPLLSERATHIELDTTKPFKLNAGTAGVCMSLSLSRLLCLTELSRPRAIHSRKARFHRSRSCETGLYILPR